MVTAIILIEQIVEHLYFVRVRVFVDQRRTGRGRADTLEKNENPSNRISFPTKTQGPHDVRRGTTTRVWTERKQRSRPRSYEPIIENIMSRWAFECPPPPSSRRFENLVEPIADLTLSRPKIRPLGRARVGQKRKTHDFRFSEIFFIFKNTFLWNTLRQCRWKI